MLSPVTATTGSSGRTIHRRFGAVSPSFFGAGLFGDLLSRHRQGARVFLVLWIARGLTEFLLSFCDIKSQKKLK
jgi:hypothetical protein